MRCTPPPVYQTPAGRHPAYDSENPRRLIRAYGCCRCQCEHVEGSEVFAAHLMCQSKHGIYDRLPTDAEAFARLVAECE